MIKTLTLSAAALLAGCAQFTPRMSPAGMDAMIRAQAAPAEARDRTLALREAEVHRARVEALVAAGVDPETAEATVTASEARDRLSLDAAQLERLGTDLEVGHE